MIGDARQDDEGEVKDDCGLHAGVILNLLGIQLEASSDVLTGKTTFFGRSRSRRGERVLLSSVSLMRVRPQRETQYVCIWPSDFVAIAGKMTWETLLEVLKDDCTRPQCADLCLPQCLCFLLGFLDCFQTLI